MIELGGNITLSGFKDRDYAELIVVKKIVGRYARQISDAHEGFERLDISLKQLGKSHELKATCQIGTVHSEAEVADKNLFIGLDLVLKKLLTKFAEE